MSNTLTKIKKLQAFSSFMILAAVIYIPYLEGPEKDLAINKLINI